MTQIATHWITGSYPGYAVITEPTRDSIRGQVLAYVKAHPGSKRSEIMDTLNLDGLQASNALSQGRRGKQLFVSGRRGNASIWSATEPKPAIVKIDQLAKMYTNDKNG